MFQKPLQKLRDRNKSLRKDVEDALGTLDQIVRQRPELADLASVNAALLRVAFREQPALPAVTLDPTHAQTKLEAGIPLLRGEAVTFDQRWLREQFLRLCDAVSNAAAPAPQSQQRAHAVAALRQAVKQSTLDIGALASDVLNGDPQRISDRAAHLGLDAGLAATLLRWTMLPILEQLAQHLDSLRTITWQRGYCPTCGAWPLLAEQRGIEQARYLRCGLCATSWSLQRIVCPFCDSRAHTDIAYLYEEGNEASQRVVTCERCHGYYKAIATLVPLTTAQLFVTDIATLHLDLVALERAYAAPS